MIDPNPYTSAGKDPKLLPSLVCFADILGWSQRTATALADGRGELFLREAREAVSRAYRRVRERGNSLGAANIRIYQVKTFTDNIVLGMPLTGHRATLAEGELGIMAFHVASLQVEMSCAGFFLRGGLAYGNNYMDEDFVFGDAILEANDQDAHGLPPRIVLAPSVETLIRSHTKFYGGKVKGTPNYMTFLEDSDKRLFVDYLSEAFIAFPDGPIFHDLLENHATRVREGLMFAQGNDSLRAKFEWLARYHNFVCDEFASSHTIAFDEDDGERIAIYEEAQRTRDYIIQGIPSSSHPCRMPEDWASGVG